MTDAEYLRQRVAPYLAGMEAAIERQLRGPEKDAPPVIRYLALHFPPGMPEWVMATKS
jgi:hypothetical protein